MVAEVARRWRVCSQQVFTWRREMRAGAAARLDFVPMVAEAPAPTPAPTAAPAHTASAIEVRLAGAVLRVEPGIDCELLTAVLRAIRASAA
ncbi:hypothetical protein GCM10011504_52350 [Siccirubricoccus deserti]|nr:hypothetical protein GCM10011504_52350 [Siccirubricoccus deserti]